MLTMYNKILSDFGAARELVGVNYTAEFKNALDCLASGVNLFSAVQTNILFDRLHNEYHFHSSLEHQLFARLQEIKAYSTVDINTTRRLIAVSHECISAIHILIRDKIYLNVYFRSSDFDGALPADLEFLCKLPSKLFYHLSRMNNVKGYDEVNPELISALNEKAVQVNLMFGSLHRTNT